MWLVSLYGAHRIRTGVPSNAHALIGPRDHWIAIDVPARFGDPYHRTSRGLRLMVRGFDASRRRVFDRAPQPLGPIRCTSHECRGLKLPACGRRVPPVSRGPGTGGDRMRPNLHRSTPDD